MILALLTPDLECFSLYLLWVELREVQGHSLPRCSVHMLLPLGRQSGAGTGHDLVGGQASHLLLSEILLETEIGSRGFCRVSLLVWTIRL